MMENRLAVFGVASTNVKKAETMQRRTTLLLVATALAMLLNACVGPGGNSIFSCKGLCAQSSCTLQAPCTIAIPGGDPEVCTNGFMCASPGTVCDPGLFDCHCTQSVQPRLGTCDCDCE